MDRKIKKIEIKCDSCEKLVIPKFYVELESLFKILQIKGTKSPCPECGEYLTLDKDKMTVTFEDNATWEGDKV